MENPIGKNQRVPLNLSPGIVREFPVKGGIEFYFDEIQITYPSKYEYKSLRLNYKDATGDQSGSHIILNGGGTKLITNTREALIPNFGFIEFSSNDEIIAEFQIITHELHNG